MIRKRPIPHHVHVGRDGWLFLVGGRNRPLAIYRRSWAASWAASWTGSWAGSRGRSQLLARWEALLRLRASRATALGCRYLHLPVPEKFAIYPEMTAGLGIDPALSLAHGLAARLSGERICIDLAPALIAAKADMPVYLRTDSHWTSAGCRIAQDAICRALDAPLRWSLAERPVRVFDSAGDLGATFAPPRRETQHRAEVARDAVRVFANPLLKAYEAAGRGSLLHRGANVVFRNDAPDADPRRLVLFGDSYAHFIDYMLSAMLAETFRELHFVWSAGIDWSYVERSRPDVVVTETAERFMSRLPTDDFDLDAFAAARLAAFRPEAIRQLDPGARLDARPADAHEPD